MVVVVAAAAAAAAAAVVVVVVVAIVVVAAAAGGVVVVVVAAVAGTVAGAVAVATAVVVMERVELTESPGFFSHQNFASAGVSICSSFSTSWPSASARPQANRISLRGRIVARTLVLAA